MSTPSIDDLVVNIADVTETPFQDGEFVNGPYKKLTPALEPRMGKLGANITRLPPGKIGCPFHAHMVADEVFFVLSGRGVLRYGDEVKEIRAGDCISCPAATGVAHQLANPFDEDLVYLAVGMNDPNEVCIYPDSGKIMIDSLNRVGFLQDAEYMAGEPATPKVFEMVKPRSHP